MRIKQTIQPSLGMLLVATATMFALVIAPYGNIARAEPANQHLITIHDGQSSRSVISSQDTLRKVFAEADIPIDENDSIEPGLDTTLVSNDYQVNIYRARPITIVDGASKIRIMTAAQTPKQIAEDASMELRTEDETAMSLSEDLLANGASMRLDIDRAVAVKLELYGKKETVYTQAETVGELLEEKSITLGPNDTVSRKSSTPVTANMALEIFRDGKQTITEDETIAPPVETIQDANQPVGYEKVTNPGKAGKRSVTYEVIMKNGKEVSRKKIQSVIIDAPSKKVVVVGAKPSFGGDFAAALAKLRSCEGGYDSINPAGPYYGAYQFDQGTWNSVSSAPYGNATPAQQDAAARALYERRGWSPWPSCGASLPDTYR